MTRRRFHRRVYLGILRRQKLLCGCGCGEKLTAKEGYQFDHITALGLNGADHPDNLRALRTPCHKAVTRGDVKAIAKAKRIARKLAGEKKRRGPKLQGRGFDKRLRKRMDGTVEARQ